MRLGATILDCQSLIAVALLVFGSTCVSGDSVQFAGDRASISSINRITGDSSWRAAGEGPAEHASEDDRIAVHLHFVADRLESDAPRGLSETQLSRRQKLLAELRDYAHARVFPVREPNDDHAKRRPRFIDHRDVHCAVAELIRRSGHGELARELNARWEFAYVEQMSSPRLEAWARAHGFERRELAMIQPTYRRVGSGYTEDEVREGLQTDKDSAVLGCARDFEPEPNLRVAARGEPGTGVVLAIVGEPTDFQRCMRRKLIRDAYVSGWSRRFIDPYQFQLILELERPRAIVERRLKELDLERVASRCGVSHEPDEIWMRVEAGEDGLLVHVDVWPESTKYKACLEEAARAALSELDHQGDRSLALLVKLRVPAR
jgi:hypothetical protein